MLFERNVNDSLPFGQGCLDAAAPSRAPRPERSHSPVGFRHGFDEPHERMIQKEINHEDQAYQHLRGRPGESATVCFRREQRQNVAGSRYVWKMMGGMLVDLLGRIS